VTVKTVEISPTNIYRKLDSAGRADLARVLGASTSKA
jgi:DNA-binding CsgD family transcriptional regulator